MTQENAVKKRIFSFDLDMTLLDHATWEIPSSAMETLERDVYKRQGGYRGKRNHEEYLMQPTF